MNRAQHQLMKVLQKLRVFEGLDLSEAERLVRICKSRKYAPDERIYKVGEPSEEMLVLVTGKLKAVSRAGEDLAEIGPGSSIGEMGVFTGQHRSASIVAVEESLALAVEKRMLGGLLKDDAVMRAKILQNVVDLLAERLAEADRQIEELKRKMG